MFIIIPWLIAGGAAGWKMETNASQIKKFNPQLAEDLKDDKDGSKKKTGEFEREGENVFFWNSGSRSRKLRLKLLERGKSRGVFLRKTYNNLK